MGNIIVDEVGCNVRHDGCRDRQVREFLHDRRNALVGYLRKRNDDAVDLAFAAGVDEVIKLASNFETFRVQSIFANAIIIDASEINTKSGCLEMVMDASSDLAGTENGDALVKAPLGRELSKNFARKNAAIENE